MERITQVSGRGTITLPADVRRTLGIAEGDVLTVTVESGRIVLTPTAVGPVEFYSEERLAEFADAQMSEEELRLARARWRAGGEPAPRR